MPIGLFLVIYSIAFLALGLWISLKVLEKRWLPKEFLYIGTVASSLTIYYAIFYLYLLSPWFANLIVKLVLLISFLAFIKLFMDFRKSKALFTLVRKFFLIPLLITGIIMFAYSTIFYSCVSRPPALAGYSEIDNRTFCHTSNLPFDNSLAFIFDGNILRNQDKKLAIDWNMVDRPPLQIAATLPIVDFGSHSTAFIKYYSYQLFSIFLQLSWIGAIWGAFQLLRLNKKFQILAFTGLASTGFFYINSVFVWPKLLASSLVFSGILILIGKNKKSKYKYMPFAALLISLGILSHSAVLFTIIPFAIYYTYVLLTSGKVNFRYLGMAAVVCLLILAPWFVYKNSIVKTDRLTKYHFAGITSYSDKRGTVETIVAQYKKLTFSDWTHAKELDVKTLLTGNFSSTPNCSLNSTSLINKCLFGEWRTITFFSTVFAFEALGLAWIAVIYQFIRRKIDVLDKELVLLIFGGLLCWIVAMFEPGSTVVHQGSYATMMLAFLLLIKKLSELPIIYMGAIASTQIIIFYLTWVTPYFRLG